MSVVTRSERRELRERLRHREFMGVADVAAAFDLIPRLLDLIDALEDSQAHAHALLVEMRYQAPACPSCGLPIHRADCRLVAALALLAQMEAKA